MVVSISGGPTVSSMKMLTTVGISRKGTCLLVGVRPKSEQWIWSITSSVIAVASVRVVYVMLVLVKFLRPTSYMKVTSAFVVVGSVSLTKRPPLIIVVRAPKCVSWIVV